MFFPDDFLDDLSDDQKNTRPSEMLFGALAPHIPSIHVLGLNLGFTRVNVEQFVSNYPHSVANQAVQLLSSWRSKFYTKATIKRLVKAYQKSELPVECYAQHILAYFKGTDSDSDGSLSAEDV